MIINYELNQKILQKSYINLWKEVEAETGIPIKKLRLNINSQPEGPKKFINLPNPLVLPSMVNVLDVFEYLKLYQLLDCVRQQNLSDVLIRERSVKSMEIQCKNLGPQVGFRFTYVLEYLGPVLLPIFLIWSVLKPAPQPYGIFGRVWRFLKTIIYDPLISDDIDWPQFVLFSNVFTPSPKCIVLFLCWELHFIRRTLESAFLHSFSRPSMPRKRALTNIIYYWGMTLFVWIQLLSGLSYSSMIFPMNNSPVGRCVFLCVFIIAELGNSWCHWHMKSVRVRAGEQAEKKAEELRKTHGEDAFQMDIQEDIAEPSTPDINSSSCDTNNYCSRPGVTNEMVRILSHVPPHSFLYQFSVTPNYGLEILVWIAFAIYSGYEALFIFMIAGAFQMWAWSIQRKIRLIRSTRGHERLTFKNRGTLLPTFNRNNWKLGVGLISISLGIILLCIFFTIKFVNQETDFEIVDELIYMF
ncbi:3-oxo-5-alpha-steroid 4-dehydrogenase/very-long-chain enoyl-CoA reductase like protein [Aduncisulcus paluster]|uniref:3-oxo-5-alpha-steroid 4-dehydrogenase/very-long-chain enoyl-CoA reductase like protein n=1 Tax=Aduncisulcus paluster TaxID=2918883 RepID=A0ABQ5KPZ5_9EUKA|nr:3-oxo-5-alpha-steroid 4-dehydrogenase/very-long-chain enoyl-CoA reductase like protein [Aduncisulcus paluster]